MEAVPRMPMIWLDLKEAGEFQFSPSVRQVSGAGGEPSNRAESQPNRDYGLRDKPREEANVRRRSQGHVTVCVCRGIFQNKRVQLGDSGEIPPDHRLLFANVSLMLAEQKQLKFIIRPQVRG